MNKNIRIIAPLLLAGVLLYGCSSTPKENQQGSEINKNQKNVEAYSDSSAPLPADSADVSVEIPGKVPDSLRKMQTRIPADRQIKDEPAEIQKTEPPVVETKKEVKKTGNYAVQLGAFSKDENATEFALSAGRKLGENPVVKLNPSNGLFVVQYGQFETRTEAEKAVKDLKKKNFKDVFIVTTK